MDASNFRAKLCEHPENREIGLYINRNKIVKLGKSVQNLYYNDTLILHIIESITVKDFEETLKQFDCEKFPCIFLVNVELPTFELCDNFLKVLSKKFDTKKLMLVEFHSKILKDSKLYQKLENESNFIEINSIGLLLSRLKLSVKNIKLNNVEEFFEIIKFLKISIITVNFKDVLTKLKIKDENLLVKHAIKHKNKVLIRIQLLYLPKLFEDVSNVCECLEILIIILENFQPYEVDNEIIENILKNTKIDQTLLLMEISQKNSVKVLKILMKDFELFSKHVSFDNWCKIREISVENNFFTLAWHLQMIEEKYCKREVITNLHNNIKIKNIGEVQEFVKAFPHFKLCLNEFRISVLQKSIIQKQFEIFSFLLSENFITIDENDVSKEISKLDFHERKEIRKFNLKYLKTNPENFVNILCTKCDLLGSSGTISFSEIRQMILKLSKKPELEFVLRNAATSDLKIVFDYKSKSVISADPTAYDSMMGLTYSEENIIYVGKNLNKIEQYGTFIHEMTHYVLQVTYDNNCLPYCKNDIAKEREWSSIFEATRLQYENSNENTDPIIRAVFEAYNGEDESIPEDEIKLIERKKAELAVRVNHMATRFLQEPEKLEELRLVHKELFDFYFNSVLPDLKIENLHRFFEINNKFGVVRRITKSDMQLKLYNDQEQSGFPITALKLADIPSFSNSCIDNTSSTQHASTSKNISIDGKIKLQNMKRDNESNVVINSTQKLLESINKSNMQHQKTILVSNVPGLTLLKLYNELFMDACNKVHVRTKNIFVDLEKLNQESLRDDFQNLIETSEIEKIFVDLKFFDDDLLNFFENIKVPTFLICSNRLYANTKPVDANVLYVTHDFNELTSISQEKILDKILIFQNKIFKISDFFTISDKISTKIFEIFCLNDKVQINCDSNNKIFENYIPRVIQKKMVTFDVENQDEAGMKLIKRVWSENSISNKPKFYYEEFLLERFIENVADENFLLISDMAGSGKTTLLWKTCEILLENNKSFNWISFISLKDYYNELLSLTLDNFTNSIIYILKLNEVEAEVFNRKFEKGEVILFFDAFDEISPNCKGNTLKLFKLFKIQDKNQIWVTTRTHLEEDIESELGVLAHRLKVLDENEQVEFLKEHWKNSHESNEFIEKCARKLVEKISQMVATNPSVIGLPLIVEGLGKFYNTEINESFNEKVEKLHISMVYDKIIIEASLNILKLKFPQKVLENISKSESILNVHQFLAIVYFFSEDFAEDLGMTHDEDEWSLEEIARGGIISYSKGEKVKFNHETYAEHLISFNLFLCLKNSKKLGNFQTILLEKILTEEKFKISRMLLDDMLKNIENQNSKLKFSMKEPSDILRLPAKERLLNIINFFLKYDKSPGKVLFKQLIEFKENGSERTILMEILPNIKCQEKFLILVEEIFNLYEELIFDKFLKQVDSDGNTMFYHIFVLGSLEIFEIFLQKLKNKISCEKLKALILHKNIKKQVSVHADVSLEKLRVLLKLIEEVLGENELKDLFKSKNENGLNAFHFSVNHSNENFYEIYSFVAKHFTSNEVRELFEEVDNDDNNMLHTASYGARSKESFEFLWLKICQIFDDPKEFFCRKGVHDRNVLQHSLYNDNDSEIFIYTLNLAESFCSNKVELKDLFLKENARNENLLILAATFAHKSNLKILFKKLFDLFQIEEAKRLLKINVGYRQRNLLCHMALNKSKSSIKFMWKILEDNLVREEMRELIYYEDEGNENFFHLAAAYAESRDIIDFFWSKVKIFLNENEIKDYLRVKGYDERNLLLTSLLCQNEATFLYLFNEIYCKIFEYEEFIYDCEEGKENIFHFLARFGTIAGLDCAMDKLSSFIDKRSNLLALTASFGQNSNFKYLFERYFKLLSKSEIKEMLKSKGKYRNRNLLCMAAYNDSKDSIEFLWKTLEEYFEEKEMHEIFYDKDEGNENFFHLTAAYARSKEIFDFFYTKVKSFFHDEELKKYLKEKGYDNRNHLQISLIGLNENSFFTLLDKIFCKIFNVRDFIYECDDLGLNFLHYLVRFGSNAMFKFGFLKLETLLTLKELQDLMKIKSEKHNYNLLHCAALSNFDLFDTENINEPLKKSVIKAIIDKLGENELKTMMSEREISNDHIPLHTVIIYNNVEIFNFFAKLYIKYFTKIEISNFFKDFNLSSWMRGNRKQVIMYEAVKKFVNELEK